MKTKEEVQELLSYLNDENADKLQYDKDIILSTYARSNQKHPLIVKVMSILGAVLASLSFMGFLFLMNIQESEVGLFISGGICIGVGIWINRSENSFVVDTFSVSLFVVGFILFGYSLSSQSINVDVVCWVFILLALLSLTVIKGYVLPFVAILIVNGSIIALLFSNKFYGEHIYFDFMQVYVAALACILSYFILNEAKIISKSKVLCRLYDPIRLGLIFSFLSGLFFLNGNWGYSLVFGYEALTSLVIISAIMFLISKLFKVLEISNSVHKGMIYFFSGALLLLTAMSPSISGSILIILVSFFVNYKTGFYIGVVVFIYFISRYYYDLNLTLLTKSILLFSSGVLFILFYLLTHKKLTANEKV